MDSQRVLTSLLQVILYISIAFMVSVEITLWAALVFGCIMMINVAYADMINKISKAYNQAFISLSTYVTLLTQNRKFFKATKSRGVFTNVVLNKVKEVHTKNWDLNLLSGILRTFTIMTGMAFVIALFLFHSMLNINISELFLLLLVFNRLAPQFTSLSGNYTRISERIPIHQSVNNRIIALKENLEVTGSKNFKTLKPN